MILHLTTSNLEWTEAQSHSEFVLNKIDSILKSEAFYYKSKEVSLHVQFEIVEHNDREDKFEVLLNNYAHVNPDVIRVEFSATNKLGYFDSLEEAKNVAQAYFNHHYHTKFSN